MIGGVLESPDPCAYKPAKQNYKLESYRILSIDEITSWNHIDQLLAPSRKVGTPLSLQM
jgi:hypothetical protein